jgi:hypothetical protein
MGIDIRNETHWRSKDIKRLIMKAAEASDTTWGKVIVRYHLGGDVNWHVVRSSRTVKLALPKQGTRREHPNPLVALAAAAIDSKTPILPVQQTYVLANGLAWMMTSVVRGALADQSLHNNSGSDLPPPWAPDIFIAKYADPLKDGTFVDFKEKKEKEIAKQQGIIDQWTPVLREAQQKIREAQAKQKKAKRSLANAKARRRK